MASIKANIILNGINTVTGIIFPVITFPYAARVLLPEGIGAVNFLNSIISYIILLTSLGIPMYAIKEVAKYQDSKEQRDKVALEILILSTFLSLFGYIAVWLLAEFIPEIHRQSALFYILSLSIVFQTIGVTWFYQGIEDFKFITIRGLIIRTLSAASLFIFVKNSSYLLTYGFIIVGSTVGNNIINFIHLRRHLNLSHIKLKDLQISRHIRPSLKVFIFNLITSLYIQLNSIMLGFLAGDVEVGYFAAGTKISHVGLTLIFSLGTVMLPHCSFLLKKGDIIRFNSMIGKSLNITLALSLPMAIGLMILSTPVTLLFCGSEYVAAIPVLLLNAPVIIFISLTNLMGIQILYPKDKINLVIWSVSGGAIINLLLNFIFIPLYGAVGAAIATLIAEFTVLLIQMIGGNKYYPFKLHNLFNKRYIIGSLIMGLTIYIAIYNIQSHIIQLIIGICIGISIYTIFLMILKDPLIMEIKNTITRKIGYANH